MSPAPNLFKTRTLAAPPNMPECNPLEVTECVLDGRLVMASAWEPTDEEIAAINRGEKIWLFIYNNCHPVVGMGVGERPF